MKTMTKILPNIVSYDEWRKALNTITAKEKRLTKTHDALDAERRRLPMVEITKMYGFQGPEGKASLLDLFEGRRQLIVYHFMFHPDWEEGCPGCSFFADNIAHPAHLHARDTNLVLVSRAPLKKLEQYQKRMGWTLPWYSSFETDFNQDFEMSTPEGETHGLSVFLRDGKKIFRTYFTGARGVESLGTTWSLLDVTPYGRQEDWEDSPEGWPQTPPYQWWRRHDRYE